MKFKIEKTKKDLLDCCIYFERKLRIQLKMFEANVWLKNNPEITKNNFNYILLSSTKKYFNI